MRRNLVVAGVVCGLLGSVRAATVYEVYRVQQGDTVESIAVKFGMRADELRALNPFLLTGTLATNELITVMIRGDAGAKASVSGPVARAGTGGANAAGGIRSDASGVKVIDPSAPVEQTAPAVAAQPEQAAPAAPAASALDKNFAVNGAVGRLGKVTSSRVPIHRQRGAGIKPLYHCDKGTRLAITRQVGDWYAVMMVDGSTGWVEAQYVELTGTELVAGQPAAGSGTGQQVLQEAYRYLGVPYRWGGESFGGIDCSGLVLQCYRKVGVRLPRTAREQFQVGTPIAWDQLQPGDRLYFASEGSRIDHTGLYLGGGQFIHASGRRRQVGIDNLFDPRYWSIYVGARR